MTEKYGGKKDSYYNEVTKVGFQRAPIMVAHSKHTDKPTCKATGESCRVAKT